MTKFCLRKVAKKDGRAVAGVKMDGSGEGVMDYGLENRLREFIIEVGGVDMFVWLLMYGMLVILVIVMAYTERDTERE